MVPRPYFVKGSKNNVRIAVPGFEPGLPDSESGVLTTTLYRNKRNPWLRTSVLVHTIFITLCCLKSKQPNIASNTDVHVNNISSAVLDLTCSLHVLEISNSGDSPFFGNLAWG